MNNSNIPRIALLGPGPSPVDERVLRAMSQPLLGHLDPASEAMGLEMLVEPGSRLWSLNAVRVPDGVDDQRVRTRLLEQHAIEIGGGLGPLRGKLWRVGLMGSGSTRDNVLLVLEALNKSLEAEGLSQASGMAAAEQVFSRADPIVNAAEQRRGETAQNAG